MNKLTIKQKLVKSLIITSLTSGLILIPLFTLYLFLVNQAEKDEQRLLLLAQEQLNNEMSEFAEALNPINYIDSAFKALRVHIGEQNKYEKILIPQRNAKEYLPNNHLEICTNFLKTNYGLNPFLSIYGNLTGKIKVGDKYKKTFNNNIIDRIGLFTKDENELKKNYIPVLSDNKRSHNVYVSKEQNKQILEYIARNTYNNVLEEPNFNFYFTKEYFRDTFIDILYGLTCDVVSSNSSDIRALYSKDLSFDKQLLDEDDFHDSIYVKFKNKLNKLKININVNKKKCLNLNVFNSQISSSVYVPSSPSQTEKFFSGKFGNQLSYHIYNTYPYMSLQQNQEVKAIDYFCINNEDIDKNNFINNALITPKSNIKRELFQISNKKISKKDLPQYLIYEDKYYYLRDFPNKFYAYVIQYEIKSEQDFKKLQDTISNYCLSTYIDKNELISKYSKWKSYIKIIIYISFAFITSIPIFVFKDLKLKKLSISSKLKIAIATSLLFPLLGSVVVSNSINNKNQNDIYYEHIEAIKLHINRLNKLFLEEMNSSFIYTQKIKKIIASNIVNRDQDAIIDHKFYDLMKKSNVYIMKYFNNDLKYVNQFCFPFKHEEDPIDIESNNRATLFYSIYQDLKIPTNKFTPNSKNFLNDKLIDAKLGLLDSYLKVALTNSCLAYESLIQHEFQTNTKVNYNSFNLISDKKNPNLPLTMCIFTYYDDVSIFNLMTKLIYKYNYLLRENINNSSVDYGIFIIGTDRLYRNTFQNVFSNPIKLYNLAEKSFKLQKSFINYSNNDIEVAYYSETLPIIITAKSTLIPNTNNDNNYYLFISFIFIYIILTIILIPNTISKAIKSPVDVIMLFIKDINQNIYSNQTNININNEFDNLSSNLNDMAQNLEQREKMRRFVSDELYKNTSSDFTKVIENQITILSSDIRSFTTISEQNTAEDIVALLNAYFTEMEKAINTYGGTIEKYVGDAITASFIPTSSNDNSAIRAAKAALAMRKNLEKLNNTRKKNNLFTIENGIGLATGKVVLGFAGKTARKKEFILLGDIISNAEKLEAETKKCKYSKVNIDEQTFNLINNNFKLNKNNSINSWEIIYEK